MRSLFELFQTNIKHLPARTASKDLHGSGCFRLSAGARLRYASVPGSIKSSQPICWFRAFNSDAPDSSVEVGVAYYTIQIKPHQNRDRHGYLLAAFNATAGSLTNAEPAPKFRLGLIEVVADVGYSLKFHVRSLADMPGEITYQYC